MDGGKNHNLFKLFKERSDEVQTLRLLCRTIKTFIKRNKETLLANKNGTIPSIIKMQKSLHIRRNSQNSGDDLSQIIKGLNQERQVSETSPEKSEQEDLHKKLKKI